MAYGVPVPVEQLQSGDRLYFGRRTDRVGVTHTGLYIGNGYFIHASSGRHGVAISQLSEPLFRRIYVCARR
jgi:cell wall-associated NlpC family hydrolase